MIVPKLLAAGSRLGPFVIDALLGTGGMGEVYRATDSRLGRTVAIKVLHPRADGTRQRLEREARAVAALNHPNICTLYDVGFEGEVGYLVMEYLEGQPLDDVLRSGPVPPATALNYAKQLVGALDAAHAKRVIHRDLKPANLFITHSDALKVLDFGIAKSVLAGDEALADTVVGRADATQAGMFVGTVGYASPEQLRAERVDHRTDIFAAGVVLAELFTGTPAFRKATTAETIAAILTSEPPSLPPTVPPVLAAAIRRCLAKEPPRRFQSARALLDSLESTDIPTGARAALEAPAAEPTPSIAVLPFADLSPEKDQEYFCDGMADELIAALMSLEGVRVASRTSAFQFKGQSQDVAEIGRRLRVSSVLEGSVRRAGPRLRISVQLTDVAEGFLVWSERYDGRMDDVFAVQDEIARAVVDRLKIRLGRRDGPLVAQATTNMEAYNLYLMGRFLIAKWTQDGVTRGMASLREAIDKQPDFAEAHAALAYGFLLQSFNLAPPRQGMPLAKSGAERALEFNPRLASGHLVLGCVRHWYDWDFEGAESAYQQALALSPGDANVWFNHAELLICREQYDEAVREAKHAMELDSLSPLVSRSLGDALYVGRRFDEAIAHAAAAITMDPGSFSMYWILGLSQAALGNFAAAVDAFERSRAVAHGDPETEAFLAWALARVGQPDRAREILAQLEERRAKGFVSATSIGLVHQGLGQLDDAIRWYRQAFDDRAGACLSFPAAHFDGSRHDERFLALMAQVARGGPAA